MYDLYVIDDGLRVSLAGVPLMDLTGDDAALVHRVWRDLGPWRGDDFLHGLLVGAALPLQTTRHWVAGSVEQEAGSPHSHSRSMLPASRSQGGA